jgi:hypothetical protein
MQLQFPPRSIQLGFIWAYNGLCGEVPALGFFDSSHHAITPGSSVIRKLGWPVAKVPSGP